MRLALTLAYGGRCFKIELLYCNKVTQEMEVAMNEKKGPPEHPEHPEHPQHPEHPDKPPKPPKPRPKPEPDKGRTYG
jgi:hypothetical protein